jgi:hypothetical protein
MDQFNKFSRELRIVSGILFEIEPVIQFQCPYQFIIRQLPSVDNLIFTPTQDAAVDLELFFVLHFHRVLIPDLAAQYHFITMLHQGVVKDGVGKIIHGPEDDCPVGKPLRQFMYEDLQLFLRKGRI